MGEKITCVYCHHLFDINQNLKFKVSSVKDFINLINYRESRPLFDGAESIEKANYLICPNCKKEVPASEYKMFGFIPHQLFRLMVIFGLGILTVAMLYEAISQLNLIIIKDFWEQVLKLF